MVRILSFSRKGFVSDGHNNIGKYCSFEYWLGFLWLSTKSYFSVTISTAVILFKWYCFVQKVKELLVSFGALKAFNLVKDAATGLSRGYAFCEYLDPLVTDTVGSLIDYIRIIQFEKSCFQRRSKAYMVCHLATRSLSCNWPVLVQRRPQWVNSLKFISYQDLNVIFSEIKVPSANSSLPVQVQVPGFTVSSGQSGPATEILCLLNMVAEEELLDDDEYEGKRFLVLIDCFIKNHLKAFYQQKSWKISKTNVKNMVASKAWKSHVQSKV